MKFSNCILVLSVVTGTFVARAAQVNPTRDDLHQRSAVCTDYHGPYKIFKNGYEYTLNYPSDWRLFGTEIDESIGLNTPAKCNVPGKRPWSLSVDVYPDMILTNEEFLASQKRRFPVVFSKSLKFGLVDSILIEQVKDEKNPFIDSEDQDNHYWTLKLVCKKNSMTLSYLEHLDKQNREMARKTHSIPKVFQALMDNVKCD